MLTFSPRHTTWLLDSHKVFQPKFYGGSKLFTPLAERAGLQIDQFNFLVCQFLALAFGFLFRKALSPDKVSVTARHFIEVFGGILLSSFCFGYQVWHLLIQSMISYVLMNYGKARFSHSMTFFWCIFYLSVVYVFHMLYDYERWTMDITWPLMVQTMKITSLAFALHDGRFKDPDNLTPDQKSQAVRKMPSLLEYQSFMFYFHGVLVGPNTFFRDYIAFIDGSNMRVASQGRGDSPGNRDDNSLNKDLNKKIQKRLVVTIAKACGCAALMVVLSPYVPQLHSKSWYSYNLLEKIWNLYVAVLAARLNCYFAWKTAEAINLGAGFGYSGLDKKGEPTYDHAENVDIEGVECSSTVEATFSAWNKKKTLWLQRVVTDRCENNPKVFTALMSAMIHGFYPGYFLTFCVVPFFVATAQMVNEHIRPMMQDSVFWRLAYQITGWTVSRLTMAYLFFPYLIVMEFYPCGFVYKSLYFYLHMIFVVTNILMVLFTGIKEAVGHPQKDQDNATSRNTAPNSNKSTHQSANRNTTVQRSVSKSSSKGSALNSRYPSKTTSFKQDPASTASE